MCVCVCVCVCVCQRKTKDRADGMRGKVPIFDGIRTCTSGVRAHLASDSPQEQARLASVETYCKVTNFRTVPIFVLLT